MKRKLVFILTLCALLLAIAFLLLNREDGFKKPETVITIDNADTIERIATLDNHPYGTGKPNVIFSSDGDWFAISTAYGVSIWDINQGHERYYLPHREETPLSSVQDEIVTQIAFGPNAEIFVTGSGFFVGGLKLWDLKTGHERQAFRSEFAVQELAVSPDGRWLVYSGKLGETNAIYAWELATQTEVLISRAATRFQFSPDGSSLVYLRDASGQLRSWNPLSGQSKTLATGMESQTQFAFDPSGAMIAIWCECGTDIHLLDSTTGHEIGILANRLGGGISHAAFSPTDPFLAVNDVVSREIHVLDVVAGTKLWTFGMKNELITHITFSPDSTILAAAGTSQLFLWDLQTGRLLNNLAENETPLNVAGSFAFSPDGTFIISSRGHLWGIRR